jgi:putative transferase (TIGR04331 family)
MVHFHCLYETDHWNASIYSQLIKGWTSVPIEKLLQSTPLKSTELTYHNLIRNRRFKRNLAHAASFVLKAYTQEDEAFFIETYLPKKQDFFMQLRMGQVPKLWIRRAAPKTKVDFTWRLWKLGNESAEGYAAIVRSMIPCHIPALYLEGYSNLIACCNDLTWPKKPRLIFTSNAYGSNDMFKAWAAGKVEVGVPLVVGQHGGMYGIGLWNSGEDHEHAISDVWLSWGWEDAERPNIKPVGNLKITRARTKSAPNGHALMVEMAMPRYSYMLYSVPVARQWLDYLDEQFRFVEALPSEIRRNLLVRLYKHDYGWDQIARWRKRFHDVQIDDGNSSMAKLINKARIYIATYNATTFLESLALDIPTIIFWNPAHWEIRNSAINSFKQLQAVGIFHNTPEAAAHHMTRIWPDIALWWYSEEVQMVRQEFCWRYSRISKRHLDDLEKIFSVFKKNL